MLGLKVTIAIVALLGQACAAGYGAGAGAGAGGFGGGNRVGGGGYGGGGYGGGGYGGGQNYPPRPFQFDYQARDEQGNVHYRNEQGDGSGAVRGSYGYTDSQGLYRVVEYVADANGFRANVRTNEPGTDSKPESPADVNMVAEQPPAGIQDRWTRYGGAGGYGGSGGYGGFGAASAGGAHGGAVGSGSGGHGGSRAFGGGAGSSAFRGGFGGGSLGGGFRGGKGAY